MEIRKANEADAVFISHLIHLASLKCNFSDTEPGPQWFFETIKPEVLQPLIASDNYLWFIASDVGKVIGVLSIFEGKLIKYFFVHPDFHRAGVASSIWQQAIHLLQSEITVRSSIFAVPFYESIGFKKSGDVNTFRGLSYQTMITRF